MTCIIIAFRCISKATNSADCCF